MAGSSQKKTIQRNNTTISFLTTYTLIFISIWVLIQITLIYILKYRELSSSLSTLSLVLFALQNSVSIYIIQCLRSWCREGALDLGGKGVVEYMQDLGKLLVHPHAYSISLLNPPPF